MKKNENYDECSINLVHEQTVKETKKNMLDQQTITNLTKLYKIYGDETRLKILYALFLNELCVCDISSVLKISQSATSHQLRVLKNMNLVKNRKQGKTVYYSLKDSHVLQIIAQGLSHIREKE